MDIYILGGGCYGTQYARWLLTGRERGKISFERLVIVDRDPRCKAAVAVEDKIVHIDVSDWVDFLVSYAAKEKALTDDLIVFSHAAPHLLGKAFVELVGRHTSVRPELVEGRTPTGAPFEKRLEKGVIAVSNATWNCPANCPEPDKCPHIHAPRNWDLEMTVRRWAEEAKLDAFYVFPARHFAFAVSAIPARAVVGAWSSLQRLLNVKKKMTIGVATTSACHGIISVFKVRRRVSKHPPPL